MFVQSLHVSPISLIVNGIRTCYSSFGNSDSYFDDIGNYVLGDKDKALISKIISSGHHSVLEHQSYTFYIEGMSRGCLQELSRHRIGVSPSVKSTRYTLKQLKNEEPFIDYIINDKSTTTIMHHDRAKKYIVYTDDSYVDNFSIKALENIRLVVDSNTPNDIAKYCLPESFKTSGQYTFNARSLIHLFELRMSPRALKEFRELACCIYFSIPDDYKFMFTNYINKEYIENYRNNKNVL